MNKQKKGILPPIHADNYDSVLGSKCNKKPRVFWYPELSKGPFRTKIFWQNPWKSSEASESKSFRNSWICNYKTMEENEGNIEFPVRAHFNIREPTKVSFKSRILKIFITSLELRKKEEKTKTLSKLTICQKQHLPIVHARCWNRQDVGIELSEEVAKRRGGDRTHEWCRDEYFSINLNIFHAFNLFFLLVTWSEFTISWLQ